MLTGEQRARLSPAAETALSSGWTPAALAAFTGANTEGVRSPFAMLTARLSPAELPPPPGRRPARPPWCGQCDQATRMPRLRRRRAAPVPALQAGRHSQPRQSCPAAGPRPSPFICATAVLRSPTVSVTNLGCRQDSRSPCRLFAALSAWALVRHHAQIVLIWTVPGA